MGIFDSIKRKLGTDIKNDNGVNEEYWDKKLEKKYYKKRGELHGEFVEFIWDNEDNWVSKQLNYKEGKKHGTCRYYWNKQISSEGNFHDGKETGIIKKYFRYGDEIKDIKLHPLIKESADLVKGIYEEFGRDGMVLERTEIDGVVFAEGTSSSKNGYYGGIYPIRCGLSEKWFENGLIKERGYWDKNDTLSIYNLSHRKGTHTQFHENGNVFKEGEWSGKIPVGTHRFYYPNGNVEFEVEYDSSSIENNDDSFPMKERILKERWYNKNGSLMSSDEIIKKGGTDPRFKDRPDGISHISWSHDSLNQENFITINDLNFKRMGEVQFYQSYYSTFYKIGHSYELV